MQTLLMKVIFMKTFISEERLLVNADEGPSSLSVESSNVTLNGNKMNSKEEVIIILYIYRASQVIVQTEAGDRAAHFQSK